MLRTTKCLRADWEVTIMPGGPKCCELFLIHLNEFLIGHLVFVIF